MTATSTAVSSTTKFTSITPNLIVRDIAKSTAFYRDVLGFEIKQTVPDAEPFVFVWLERDGVPVFLNDIKAAEHDYPAAAELPRGGTRRDVLRRSPALMPTTPRSRRRRRS